MSIKEIDFIIKNLPTNKTKHSRLKVCTCQFKIQGRNVSINTKTSQALSVKRVRRNSAQLSYMEPELPWNQSQKKTSYKRRGQTDVSHELRYKCP